VRSPWQQSQHQALACRQLIALALGVAGGQLVSRRRQAAASVGCRESRAAGSGVCGGCEALHECEWLCINRLAWPAFRMPQLGAPAARSSSSHFCLGAGPARGAASPSGHALQGASPVLVLEGAALMPPAACRHADRQPDTQPGARAHARVGTGSARAQPIGKSHTSLQPLNKP
jgi:hypothetical protein